MAKYKITAIMVTFQLCNPASLDLLIKLDLLEQISQPSFKQHTSNAYTYIDIVLTDNNNLLHFKNTFIHLRVRKVLM